MSENQDRDKALREVKAAILDLWRLKEEIDRRTITKKELEAFTDRVNKRIAYIEKTARLTGW